jgi:predicted porin
MQKKLIALAVAGLVSGAAFAQSNVTIYGIADVAYGYVQSDGYKSIHAIESGGLSPSRIGFKGVEDLGNGVSALFVLEYGLDIAGADGIGAARQELVGLTGAFGTVVAGRAQTAGYDFACATSAYAGGYLDAYRNTQGSVLLSCSNNGRAENAFAYISPSFAGVTIAYNHSRVTEAQFPKGVDKNNAYANLLAVKYANGPIAAQAVYSKVSKANLLDESIKEWGINGSYDFGVAKVYASYQSKDVSDLDNKDTKWGVSASFPIADTGGAVHAGYAQSNLKETYGQTAKAKSYTVAYTHGLSKRTTAYAGYTLLKNGSDFMTETVLVKNEPIGVDGGGKSSIFAVGLRHSF